MLTLGNVKLTKFLVKKLFKKSKIRKIDQLKKLLNK